MKYIKFELKSNGDGTYQPLYYDADDGITKEAQEEYDRVAALSRENIDKPEI